MKRPVLIALAIAVVLAIAIPATIAVHRHQVAEKHQASNALQERVWLAFTPDQQRHLCTMTTDPDLLGRFLTGMEQDHPDFDTAAFTTVLFEHC